MASALNGGLLMMIVHATDLSGDDRAAFEHAAALALSLRARLVNVHAGPEPASPPVVELATRWERTIDHELLRVADDEDPADAVAGALRKLAPSLVVVGTHARHGVSALVHASVAEAIARNVDQPVLVVPNGSTGFVDARNGSLVLGRIIIPAGTPADAVSGVNAARAFAAMLSMRSPEVELVHAGGPDPKLSQLGLPVVYTPGPLEDAVAARARDHEACLIVMSTRGHDGVLDVLRGSHTERVIRDARCPVLSVPLAHTLRG
jgi:nucleotide-binding universal stress UspA family protein